MTDRYDYIIIGAGAAGCVLANRLTADPAIRVLLLEAGGQDRHPLLKLPIAWPMAMQDPRFGWGYLSEPEPHLDGRQIPLPRGKMLGGSTSINGMRYSRGHPSDFDQWRQLGLKGWGYDDVLPYFRKSERSWRGDGRYHGGDGPLNVRVSAQPPAIYRPLADAAAAAGFAETDDIHGDVTEGMSRPEITMSAKGRRQSASVAFLRPAMARPNLTVVTGALTTRILVGNGTAIGVEYRRDGARVTVLADAEVILSGGAYNSPQVLMLSGIGPVDELRQHGIAVVHAMPGVGRNLMEHPLVPVVMEVAEGDSFLRHLRWDRAAQHALRWFLTGGGLYTDNGNSAGLFIRSRPGLDRPDLQLLYSAMARDSRLWWPGRLGTQKFAVQCSISLQYALSRGSVTLRSAKPEDAPRIRLNLFADQADIDTVIRGIHIARDIFGRSPMREKIKGEIAPGADIQSDADLAAYIRRTAATTQHACGTCRMGHDDTAVVDDRLRLRGIDRLRVIDASVMPTIPSGHINAPTIMIAEKGADMVLEDRARLTKAAA